MKTQIKIFFALIIFLFFNNLNLTATSHNITFDEILNSKPNNYVMDYAGVIGDKYKREISALCNYLNKKSSIEIAVVSLPELENYTIEEAAVRLFEKWGIGKKGKDNGLLFIFSLKPRRVRIEVGYGLEEVITDAEAGRILDRYTLPFFKKNEFGKGTYITVIALIDRLNKYYHLNLDLSEANKYLAANQVKKGVSIGTIIFWILILFIFLPRMGWLFWFFLIPFGGGFGSGGYHSDDNDFFGGFGGGFGGFGGGMSGGGGASRGF